MIINTFSSYLTDYNQKTIPEELPINGSLSEISLQLVSETHKYFDLIDKKLVLNKPIDRDVSEKNHSNQINYTRMSINYLF